MAKYKISLYGRTDDDYNLIQSYESDVCPEKTEHVKCLKNKVLYIEDRIHNANEPEKVEIYGILDNAV